MGVRRIFIDRSRIEAGAHCPRMRYYEYHHRGVGVVKAREIPPPWALLTGTWTHSGIEGVLQGRGVMDAALGASQGYREAIQPLIAAVEDGPLKDGMVRDLKEQSEMVLALVYAWGRVRYPAYITDFEPIAMEQEEEITFTVGDAEVTLLTRLDLLSKFRSADAYQVHNFKTVSIADEKWRKGWRYDQQTLTEFMAIENRLGKQVTGTVIEGLLKGRRSEYPEGSGIWTHNNPLVWLWYRAAEPPMTEAQFEARYAWECKEPHGRVLTKGARAGQMECPGGRTHKLSGVHKAPVADVYPGGIPAWIDHLIATDPEIVSRHFILLEPLTRSDYEVERWKRQVLQNEVKHTWAAEQIAASEDPESAEAQLDYHFPMVTGHGNCIRPWECPYLNVCWGTADIDDSTLFRPRSPNHPKEGGLG